MLIHNQSRGRFFRGRCGMVCLLTSNHDTLVDEPNSGLISESTCWFLKPSHLCNSKSRALLWQLPWQHFWYTLKKLPFLGMELRKKQIFLFPRLSLPSVYVTCADYCLPYQRPYLFSCSYAVFFVGSESSETWWWKGEADEHGRGKRLKNSVESSRCL